MIVDIYLITNTINGKEYVGITKQGYLNRFSDHKRNTRDLGKRGQSVLYNAMRKYGVENFKVELLEQVDSYGEAKVKEQEYISRFNTYIRNPLNWGYNMTIGGDSIWECQFTKQRRIEISKLHRKLHKDPVYREKFLKRMRSKEVREKIGNSNRGERNGMYGNGHLISGERNHWFGKTGEDHIQYGRVRNNETKEIIRKNTIKHWNENEEFRDSNLKHLKELGEKQKGLNNPSAKRMYLYDLEQNLIGEHTMKELYDILDTYPANVRKHRDTGVEYKGYYIYSNKLTNNKL